MPNHPNILFVISDQHSPHFTGYGGNPKARTQTLDRLASEGTRFDAAYCQAPLCVPSRISMLTGQDPYHCCAWGNQSLLYPEHLTFAEHFSNNGYTTALVGKMHLKGPKWMGGFDHRPYGDMVLKNFCFHQPDPLKTWDGRWSNHKVGQFPWAGESEMPESMMADHVVTKESLAFLLEHQDKNPDKPWLLCASYGRPHFPFTTPGRYFRRAMADGPELPPRPAGYPESLHPHDKFAVDDYHLYDFPDDIQARCVAAYYACVHYMDDCIAELLDGLQRADLLENTYIIYTSDHGEMCGEHGIWSKRTYYDGSTGVPMIVTGPGIAGGKVITSPVELLDMFPTLCEMAGLPLSDKLDGESLMPIMQGQRESRNKRYVRAELLNPRPEIAFRMARDDRWKYVEFPAAPPRLFDLVNDPGENTDLLADGKYSGEAPLDNLKQAASAGLSWDDIAAMRAEEEKRRPEGPEWPNIAPVQYQLKDGRIVDADAALYPGMIEAKKKP